MHTRPPVSLATYFSLTVTTIVSLVVVTLGTSRFALASVYGCGPYSAHTYNQSCVVKGTSSSAGAAASSGSAAALPAPTLTDNSAPSSTDQTTPAAIKDSGNALTPAKQTSRDWLRITLFSFLVILGVSWFGWLLFKKRRRHNEPVW